MANPYVKSERQIVAAVAVETNKKMKPEVEAAEISKSWGAESMVFCRANATLDVEGWKAVGNVYGARLALVPDIDQHQLPENELDGELNFVFAHEIVSPYCLESVLVQWHICRHRSQIGIDLTILPCIVHCGRRRPNMTFILLMASRFDMSPLLHEFEELWHWRSILLFLMMLSTAHGPRMIARNLLRMRFRGTSPVCGSSLLLQTTT